MEASVFLMRDLLKKFNIPGNRLLPGLIQATQSNQAEIRARSGPWSEGRRARARAPALEEEFMQYLQFGLWHGSSS